VEACRYGALSLVPADPAAECAATVNGSDTGPSGGSGSSRLRAAVDPARCVLCGYCAAACRDFYIKVV